MGVYLTSVCLMAVHLTGGAPHGYASHGRTSHEDVSHRACISLSVYLMGLHLLGPHLLGLHLMGVCTSWACTSWASHWACTSLGVRLLGVMCVKAFRFSIWGFQEKVLTPHRSFEKRPRQCDGSYALGLEPSSLEPNGLRPASNQYYSAGPPYNTSV
jgi:hypothetical protein